METPTVNPIRGISPNLFVNKQELFIDLHVCSETGFYLLCVCAVSNLGFTGQIKNINYARENMSK